MVKKAVKKYVRLKTKMFLAPNKQRKALYNSGNSLYLRVFGMYMKVPAEKYRNIRTK